MKYTASYDVIVVGGGHAGCEAAVAAAKMDCKVLLVTINLDTIGYMSCNPAVGGLAKGHLVKEIDALGGIMAKCTDRAAIQYRILNASKGYAVRSTRAQVDRALYKEVMRKTIETITNLTLRQALVKDIIVKDGVVCGIKTSIGEEFYGKVVILTPGTFLNGVIHIGLTHYGGGRLGDIPAVKLSQKIRNLGFKVGRFKTGTCPRLDGRTIDFSKTIVQPGDEGVYGFSRSTGKVSIEQIPCYITYTTEETHKIILDNLDRSPLYTGKIKATGVRYCPSIEDKVVKFRNKPRHQIFLEPEGRNTYEIYPNGVATSLPIDVQIKMLRSISGLENVEIIRPGYGIEHDYIDPTQLYHTMETKLIKNLFFAGQINGTTGYEEAAAQGLIAGINAALRVHGQKEFVLTRAEAYIGVLIDDLVTKGTNEPYRMFTSRAEYRLLLREDNADHRLLEKGYSLGLVSKEEYKEFKEKQKLFNQVMERINSYKLRPTNKIKEILHKIGTSPIKKPTYLADLMRRQEIGFEHLKQFDPELPEVPEDIAHEVEVELKYKGYIQKELEEIEKFNSLERIKIPPEIDYSKISGISREIQEKLTAIKPATLGQASRISGVTPAAISILMVYIKKLTGE